MLCSIHEQLLAFKKTVEIDTLVCIYKYGQSMESYVDIGAALA